MEDVLKGVEYRALDIIDTATKKEDFKVHKNQASQPSIACTLFLDYIKPFVDTLQDPAFFKENRDRARVLLSQKLTDALIQHYANLPC